jgi:hypothetical protein
MRGSSGLRIREVKKTMGLRRETISSPAHDGDDEELGDIIDQLLPERGPTPELETKVSENPGRIVNPPSVKQVSLTLPRPENAFGEVDGRSCPPYDP